MKEWNMEGLIKGCIHYHHNNSSMTSRSNSPPVMNGIREGCGW